MKNVAIGLLLICGQTSFAQVYTIKEIKKQEDAYVFPLIESTQRPAIAKKMNTIIQTDVGGDPKSADPFGGIELEDEYSFETGTVNPRVISMIVTGSHTGAGLHITRYTYNFDSRTGTPIDLNHVFGAAGQAKLKKMLYKAWTAALKAATDDAQHGEEYKACLAGAEAEKTTELEHNQVLINDHGISFWAGYCLEGTTYEFEADRGKGPHEFSFGQLLPILTPYGYSLFADKTAGPVQTLLRGTIDNKYPISMTLLPPKEGSAPGTIAGMIVYDRVGEPINLSGTLNGNLLVFHELDGSNNPLSNIEVAWDGTKLSGTFVNLKSKKSMPFLVSVVK